MRRSRIDARRSARRPHHGRLAWTCSPSAAATRRTCARERRRAAASPDLSGGLQSPRSRRRVDSLPLTIPGLGVAHRSDGDARRSRPRGGDAPDGHRVTALCNWKDLPAGAEVVVGRAARGQRHRHRAPPACPPGTSATTSADAEPKPSSSDWRVGGGSGRRGRRRGQQLRRIVGRRRVRRRDQQRFGKRLDADSTTRARCRPPSSRLRRASVVSRAPSSLSKASTGTSDDFGVADGESASGHTGIDIFARRADAAGRGAGRHDRRSSATAAWAATRLHLVNARGRLLLLRAPRSLCRRASPTARA